MKETKPNVSQHTCSKTTAGECASDGGKHIPEKNIEISEMKEEPQNGEYLCKYNRFFSSELFKICITAKINNYNII